MRAEEFFEQLEDGDLKEHLREHGRERERLEAKVRSGWRYRLRQALVVVAGVAVGLLVAAAVPWLLFHAIETLFEHRVPFTLRTAGSAWILLVICGVCLNAFRLE